MLALFARRAVGRAGKRDWRAKATTSFQTMYVLLAVRRSRAGASWVLPPPPFGLLLCGNGSVPLCCAPLAQLASDASTFRKSWQPIDLTHCDVLVVACPLDCCGHHDSVRLFVPNHNGVAARFGHGPEFPFRLRSQSNATQIVSDCAGKLP